MGYRNLETENKEMEMKRNNPILTEKMTPRIDIIALCDHTSIDTDGRLNINGIFNIWQIINPEEDLAGNLVVQLTGKPYAKYELKIKIIRNGELVKSFPERIVTKENGKNYLLMEIENLKPEISRYAFQVYYKNQLLKETHLDVERMKN